MEPFVIRSARDSSELRLGPPDFIHGGLTYLAELRGPVVNAAVEVHDLEVSALISFMTSLAKDWRGWEGRTWRSLEGHLQLDCRCDLLGPRLPPRAPS